MTGRFLAKKTKPTSLVYWLSACCLGLASQTVSALPFGMFDARTMAMGGVGVATGTQFAAFNNPALLTTADEIHEWFVLAPTLSRQVNDPDNVEDTLSAFQQAADTLDANNTPANQNAVQQRLDALAGSQHYGTRSNGALVLAIPSRILSGAAFFNVYKASTAQPVIGGDNPSAVPPSYASRLRHRGLRVVENGVAAATTLDAGSYWARNLALGISTKFLLVEAYGIDEPLRSAEVSVNRSDSKSGSQFTFDVGLLKEFGVWKLGLVAKNIVPGNYEYGSSGERFKIEPQLRAGFAYQSRRTVIELDVDLLENKPVGADAPSQVAALGWEWQTWDWLMLRAGYRQNLTADGAGYASAGLGLYFDALQIDVATFSGDEGEGVSAQLGLQF